MKSTFLTSIVVLGALARAVAAQPAPAPAPVEQPAAAAPAAAPSAPAPKTWWEKEAALPYKYYGNYWLPPAASSAAEGSDTLFIAVLGMSAFFFIAIAGAIVYFVIRYRHRPGHKAEPSSAHNDTLEITWTVIPTIIVVFLFVYGWRSYMTMTSIPETRAENQILVTGSKWSWEFRYYNGTTDKVLHVPVNEPVKITITATDVLHSFFVPVFRVKQDAVPRRYTYAWFYATKPGVYRVYCAEYCGTSHSEMKTVVVVHQPGDYERYLSDKFARDNSVTGPELGRLVFENKGCNSCHTIDGSSKIGPTWKGDWGQTATLADGSTITVDETYIRNSIQTPQAQARPGYPPSMPVTGLSDREIDGVIALFKSLK